MPEQNRQTVNPGPATGDGSSGARAKTVSKAVASTEHAGTHNTGTVRSCLCLEVSFERIKEAAGDGPNGLLEAHRKTGCGGRCGLCLPYIKLMLMTGQTALPVMWSEQFAAHGINPGRVKAIEGAISRQQAEMDAADAREDQQAAAG